MRGTLVPSVARHVDYRKIVLILEVFIEFSI
jgi:hypothetical protein